MEAYGLSGIASELYHPDAVETEIDKEEYSLTRINNTYSYILRGRVCENGYLDVGHGVKFCSEDLFDESYNKRKFVELTVDRLDVEFLSMD